jgi:hypothetical protein
MSDPNPHSSGGGCLSKLTSLLLFVLICGFGAALYLLSQAQDLSDLKRADPTAPVGRNLKVVLRNAIDRSYPVTLSEAELNAWLARTLVTKQAGVFHEKASLDRVWVRLEKDVAEVVMERRLWGRPFTVSMYLQIERMEGMDGVGTEIRMHGRPFHEDFPKPPRGGRFGQLVVPQGFLIFVTPAYKRLAAVFTEEIDLAFREMARIRIEDGSLVLDPREPLGDAGMPMTF